MNFVIFSPVTNRLKHFATFFHNWLTNFLNFFSHYYLMNFEILTHNQIMKFTVSPPQWSMDIFYEFFLLQPWKRNYLKGHIKNIIKGHRVHKIIKKGCWVYKVVKRSCKALCPAKLAYSQQYLHHYNYNNEYYFDEAY